MFILALVKLICVVDRFNSIKNQIEADEIKKGCDS